MQSSNDGESLDRGSLKALKNGLQNKILKWKVCKFSTFFSGIECRLALFNVKCFIEAKISGVVFAHNNLDINTFIVFVLAGIDMFFNRGIFIADMFSYSVVDEACRATNMMLIVAVTRELVHCISS